VDENSDETDLLRLKRVATDTTARSTLLASLGFVEARRLVGREISNGPRCVFFGLGLARRQFGLGRILFFKRRF
jgi:hypothetical protein